MSTATPKKAAEPKVDLDSTRERLVRLGMQHAADQLEPRLSDTIKNGASPHRMLDQLLDEELVWREERRIRTALRLSGLPTGQTLGSFDFSFHVTSRRSLTEASMIEPMTDATRPELMKRSSAISVFQLFFGMPSAPRISAMNGKTGADLLSSTTIALWRSCTSAPSERAASPIFDEC